MLQISLGGGATHAMVRLVNDGDEHEIKANSESILAALRFTEDKGLSVAQLESQRKAWATKGRKNGKTLLLSKEGGHARPHWRRQRPAGRRAKSAM